jgi:hypothetical protein
MVCADRRTSALPAVAEAVCAFLAFEANRSIKPSTLGRRVAAIRHAHKLAGLMPPSDDERVRAVMCGIRRSLGTAPRQTGFEGQSNGQVESVLLSLLP